MESQCSITARWRGGFRTVIGPGYRVYFGRKDKAVVILLCGGEKRSQNSDIKRAKKYWKDYETRTKEDSRGRSAR